MSNKKIYDLVFEGGGAKGSVFVGALTAFNEENQHRRLIGTSAGAITATLLAAGFSPEEMCQIVNEKQDDGTPVFASFMDTPEEAKLKPYIETSTTIALFKDIDIPMIPNLWEDKFDEWFIAKLLTLPHYRKLFSFVERGGLYAGDKFLEWIKAKLSLKIKGFDDNKPLTLAEFHRVVSANQSVSGTNELSLVATDTDGQKMLVLNHRTAPDCPVAWAVRMSMSIPFVWQEVVWQEEWGNYLGSPDIIGHRIVDGGVLSNFPIALIDKQHQAGSEEAKIMGTDIVANAAGTIGLLIDETLSVAGQPDDIKQSTELKTVQRVSRLIDTMTGARDLQEIASHANLVCHLPTKGYGTTEFDMSDARLQALIDAGQQAMRVYLASL